MLDGRDEVEPENGLLSGTISGLAREHPHLGLLFERLATRVQGICDYPDEAFVKQHQALAPDSAQSITVEALGQTLRVPLEAGRVSRTPQKFDFFRQKSNFSISPRPPKSGQAQGMVYNSPK